MIPSPQHDCVLHASTYYQIMFLSLSTNRGRSATSPAIFTFCSFPPQRQDDSVPPTSHLLPPRFRRPLKISPLSPHDISIIIQPYALKHILLVTISFFLQGASDLDMIRFKPDIIYLYIYTLIILTLSQELCDHGTHSSGFPFHSDRNRDPVFFTGK